MISDKQVEAIFLLAAFVIILVPALPRQFQNPKIKTLLLVSPPNYRFQNTENFQWNAVALQAILQSKPNSLQKKYKSKI